MKANIDLPVILEEQQRTKEPISYPIGSWWKSEYGEKVQVVGHLGSMVLVEDANGVAYCPLSLSPL
jgi:hypothetical protein